MPTPFTKTRAPRSQLVSVGGWHVGRESLAETREEWGTDLHEQRVCLPLSDRKRKALDNIM